MSYLLKKVSGVSYPIIGAHLEGTDFLISSFNDRVIGKIDGHNVINSSKDSNIDEILSPVISQVIVKSFEDKVSQGKKVSFFKFSGCDTDPLSNRLANKVTYYLNKKIGSSNIILEDKKDPANFVQPLDNILDVSRDYPRLNANLEKYKDQVETLSKYLERSSYLSGVLTRRKLISTMHGADATQKVICSIRDNISNLASEESNIHAWATISIKSQQKLSHRLEKNLIDNENEKVYASTVLIPNIIDHYEKIKNFTVRFATALSPLIYIDDVFKNNTKFPATWFLPTNNIEDLNESYGVVLSFILNIPNIESNLINPLNLLRVKNIFKDKK